MARRRAGSPSLPAFVAAHTELLAADAALSFDGGFDADDRPQIGFGSQRAALRGDPRARGAARTCTRPARGWWRTRPGGSSGRWPRLKGPDERVNLDGLLRPDPPGHGRRARGAGARRLGRRGAAPRTGRRPFPRRGQRRRRPSSSCSSPRPAISRASATGWMGEGHKTVLPSRAGLPPRFPARRGSGPRRRPGRAAPLPRRARLRGLRDRGHGLDRAVAHRARYPLRATRSSTPRGRSTASSQPSARRPMPPAGRASGWAADSAVSRRRDGHRPARLARPRAERVHHALHYLRGIKYSATVLDAFGAAGR